MAHKGNYIHIHLGLASELLRPKDTQRRYGTNGHELYVIGWQRSYSRGENKKSYGG